MTTATEDEEQQTTPTGGAVVVFDNVTIGFEGKPVLRDISFTVAPGETRIVLGPAGCGKSVLMKLTNGLLQPDSGRVIVFDEEVSSMREQDLFPLRGRVGMVFQESALFDSLTVRDNVGYRLQEEKTPPETIERRVKEALSFVELEHTMDKFPSQLSGGMRRRVAIARAIVNNPELLLYDSPTGGLDPITSTTIVELIVKQRDVFHTTALLVTHRIQDAFTLATHHYDQQQGKVVAIPNKGIEPSTRYLVLNEGKVVFDGDTEALVRSDDPWLKEYLS